MKHTMLLEETTTFKDLVERLDEGGIGFLAFVDSEYKLIGIVTDGDLRRALLKQQVTLERIINKSPEVMDASCSRREIAGKLKKLHRRHMPLVETDGTLKSVFTLDDIDFITRPNTVVIMAGGLGTRLGELTKETPKPMLKVGSRPLIQHLVEAFSEYGFRNFVFCVNYKKEVIQDHFGDGGGLGVNIEYVEENKRMGTAGALSLLKEKPKNPFFVINADVLSNLDFADVMESHNEANVSATMCVRKYEHQVPFGIVKSTDEGHIKSIVEKPDLSFDVNAGIYILEPEVLDLVPSDQFFDMPSLFEKIIDSTVMSAGVYRINDYWIDIGRKEDLSKANRDLDIDRLQ